MRTLACVMSHFASSISTHMLIHPAVVRRQSTIPKGATIDGIISPKPRPAKSFPSATPTQRPVSPQRALTEPLKPLGRPIFPALTENVGIFPDHVAIREVTVIINERTITDRDGDVLFQIDRKKAFSETNG